MGASSAAEAGVCPVTHASGKSRGVVFRWACNKNLRRAITCFADNSRHASPWAAAVYAQARARGCEHPHAIRILGRAWLALLLVPPATVIGASILLPWTLGIGFDVDRPASAMGEFFTDTFHRRTAAPLRIVAGDAEVAGLVAMASPDRPSLFLPDRPDLTPWVSDADVRQKGAIVLWQRGAVTMKLPPLREHARFRFVVRHDP